MRFWTALVLAVASMAIAGCGTKETAVPLANSSPSPSSVPDEVAAERAKLSAEDKSLVEAQEWCVVSDDERLGSMGPPLKLDIKGQPVFVCCSGCKRKAEADPDKTLATVAELKAKKAAGSSK